MCGPRLGELHVLHVDDVEIHARSDWLRIRRGKGSQPRNAPIKADLRPILSRWIAVRRVWPGADTCALWQSTQGRRAAGSTLDRVFDEVGAAADVPLSAHTLRHTFVISPA